MKLIVTITSVCLLLSGCVQALNIGGMLLRNAAEPEKPKSQNESQGATDEAPRNKSTNHDDVVKEVLDPKAQGKRAQNF